MLLGRTFPSALFDKKAKTVPGFSWKLLILSEYQILEPAKPINEEIVSQRYNGKFIANNKNALFRDIYTIEKASFPLAFRLTTAHKRPVTGSARALAAEEKKDKKVFSALHNPKAMKALHNALTVKGKKSDLSLSVKLYRASDMKLVAEHKGKETVICYYESIDKFLPDGETFDVAAAVAAAAEAKAAAAGGKKDAKAAPAAKPGAKGAAPSGTSDTVDVLIECTLDDEQMIISEDWQSRFPHVFDCLYPDVSITAAAHAAEAAEALGGANDKDKAKDKKGGADAAAEGEDGVSKNTAVIQQQMKCLGLAPPSEPLIKWQMDLLSGKVVNLSHDIRALEMEVAVKNSWEESSAGRAEKSAAALRYYQERRSAMKKLLEDAKLSDTDTRGAAGSRATSAMGAAALVASGVQQFEAQSVSSKVAPPPAPSPELSAVMVESLVTALQTEAEQVRQRYSVLLNIAKVNRKKKHFI